MPRKWRDLVGAYLDAASAAVTEMGGHVAKKLGDGLMALFGYPVAQEKCRAAGVPGSAHGLRKIAATRAANAGATVAQLEAIFGWSGGRMASLYTRAADRRRLAIEGMHKLANS